MLVLVALSKETLQLANGNAKNKPKRANYSGMLKKLEVSKIGDYSWRVGRTGGGGGGEVSFEK